MIVPTDASLVPRLGALSAPLPVDAQAADAFAAEVQRLGGTMGETDAPEAPLLPEANPLPFMSPIPVQVPAGWPPQSESRAITVPTTPTALSMTPAQISPVPTAAETLVHAQPLARTSDAPPRVSAEGAPAGPAAALTTAAVAKPDAPQAETAALPPEPATQTAARVLVPPPGQADTSAPSLRTRTNDNSRPVETGVVVSAAPETDASSSQSIIPVTPAGSLSFAADPADATPVTLPEPPTALAATPAEVPALTWNAPSPASTAAAPTPAAPSQTAQPFAERPPVPLAEIPVLIEDGVRNSTSDRIVVQLDPPELGRVSIDFKFDASGLQHVTIMSETPETARQLRLLQADLVSALERQGLSGHSMSFDHQGSGTQRDAQPALRQAALPARADLSAAAPPPPTVSIPRAAPASGRIDLKL